MEHPTDEPTNPAILSGEPSENALRFMRHVLRPLMRLAVMHGVRLDWLIECIKQLLVEEVQALHPATGRRLADATASMLTGVHRADVKRIRSSPAQAVEPPRRSIPQQVVEAWTGHPSMVDRRGALKPLQRLASVGGEQSFEALVRRVSGSVTPRAVLDALLRDGVVIIDEHDRVHCPAPRFAADDHDPQQAFGVLDAEIVHDDLASVAYHHRHRRGPTRWAVYDTGLTRRSVDLVRQRYEKESLQMVQRLNRVVMARKQADAQAHDAVHRVLVALFMHDEQDALGQAQASVPSSVTPSAPRPTQPPSPARTPARAPTRSTAVPPVPAAPPAPRRRRVARGKD